MSLFRSVLTLHFGSHTTTHQCRLLDVLLQVTMYTALYAAVTLTCDQPATFLRSRTLKFIAKTQLDHGKLSTIIHGSSW